MIHYLNNGIWEKLPSVNNSIRYIREYTKADQIKSADKLAEYVGFGFDVYVFIDPVTKQSEGDKTLVHFTDKTHAEEEYHRLIESV